ncbi:MAG: conjugal transfer protein TrbF [Gemmatimonadaceae bacterium]
MFGDLARSKRNWQLLAFALTGVLALLGAAHLRLAATSRVVPYVVEVDRLGRVTAVANAEAMRTPADRLVAWQLADFVRSVRTVLPAAAGVAQEEMMRRGYALAATEATAFLNDHFADPRNDPRALGERLSRQVEVTAVIRVPASDVWRIQWRELERSFAPSGPPRASAWEAYLRVRLVPPATADVLQANPLGVYIIAIGWTQLADSILPSASDVTGPRTGLASPPARAIDTTVSPGENP